jgi:phosphate/sulfate permease
MTDKSRLVPIIWGAAIIAIFAVMISPALWEIAVFWILSPVVYFGLPVAALIFWSTLWKKESEKVTIPWAILAVIAIGWSFHWIGDQRNEITLNHEADWKPVKERYYTATNEGLQIGQIGAVNFFVWGLNHEFLEDEWMIRGKMPIGDFSNMARVARKYGCDAIILFPKTDQALMLYDETAMLALGDEGPGQIGYYP